MPVTSSGLIYRRLFRRPQSKSRCQKLTVRLHSPNVSSKQVGFKPKVSGMVVECELELKLKINMVQ
ncbi:hypothetical protein CIHG_06114 [Coccidioides immitis H538.4]|uniref:Uncharacterized protein n=1 Tax=Coccidioides immitis H538.4 TaxID=396776 RepID=A0A0J8RUT9_COCIT|nr:hypothetical protein CIHG_06114 [Coccidioides immitis H538.4]